MSYVDLEEHLGRIVGNEGREREAVGVRIALTDHPGVIGYKHTTGEILVAGKEINVFCDDVLIELHGGTFVALPFTESKATRLHSNPVVFPLGVQNNLGFGIVPYTDWVDLLESAKIDNKIIRKIRTFLLAHCPANYL